jgi:UDP-N-acetylmuramyl pentapeptide synthase
MGVPASLVSGANSNSKTLTTYEYFQNFCREIINRHYFIRSAAKADNVGHFMATAYRRRLIPFMTQEDSSRAAAQAAIRAATRNKFKSKIGDLQFSLSRYEKLVRATVPIKNGENQVFVIVDI